MLRPGHGPDDGTTEAEVFIEAPAGCYTVRTRILGKDGYVRCAGREAEIELSGHDPLEVALPADCP